MAFLQETEHAHNRKASDSYALPPTHHAWFYFLNASNKTKATYWLLLVCLHHLCITSVVLVDAAAGNWKKQECRQ